MFSLIGYVLWVAAKFSSLALSRALLAIPVITSSYRPTANDDEYDTLDASTAKGKN